MFPSFVLFNKEISMYAIMTIIGLLSALFIFFRIYKLKQEANNEALTILLLSCIGLFIGSHLLYGITNTNKLIYLFKNLNLLSGFKEFVSCLGLIFGGNVFYGGLIGLLLTSVFLVRNKKVNKSLLFDTLAVMIPLFHFFGRIGCFLVGCCYGVESSFGFTFTHSAIGYGDGVSRFPIQLVEALFNLILFIILYIYVNKDKFKGYLINIYLFAYPLARFIFEFLRGDKYRGFLFGLSTSQIISILLIIINICVIFVKKRRVHN